MFVKGFGIAVKLTFAGKNQFVYPSTYLFGAISAACIVIQLNCYKVDLGEALTARTESLSTAPPCTSLYNQCFKTV
ncbi:hypothetical protein MIND_01252900 [Mycena indigotica]|uniref:Uncharacterized protein n=1 Tax=Mycena indigotica TaxID=2126181 RepID=A0A8H6S2G4_9AGAR|nr:uncharacterized protein MIND_01252900 [Mycena indigotica]KAF7291098.1 hypothetical protein MIND_01252900 [Mycena indigotica]